MELQKLPGVLELIRSILMQNLVSKYLFLSQNSPDMLPERVISVKPRKKYWLLNIVRRGWVLLMFCLVASLWLSGCLPQPEPIPLPTDTPLPPSATPTPTVIWFPATATPTLYPTPEPLPTENMRPGIGAIIYQDDFTDPEAWSLATSPLGSVALGLDELTIVINAEDTYLYTVRRDWNLSDFYLELTASPSMCRELDEYGILLRFNSAGDFYRFSLSCNGQIRLDRIYQGKASSPQPWLVSYAVPPGAPSSSRLGVWAVGSEMRFFVNDHYQFTITDPLLLSGGLGVFARSTIDWPLTVNFSELVVYSVH